MPKKRRTRQHIIADLSVNHVERLIFRCGYSVEKIFYDYGTDLIISTYDTNGEIENGLIYVQVKASDRLQPLKSGSQFAVTVKISDLDLWLQELMPYILILYDAEQDIAYWIYLQAEVSRIQRSATRRTSILYVEKRNILNEDAIQQFAFYKNRVLQQVQEIIRHET